MASMPSVSTAVYAAKTYPDFYAYFTSFAKDNHIVFWDLNLLRQRNEIIPDEDMNDLVHIGDNGVKQISRKVGKLLRDSFNNKVVEKEFWPSVEAWKSSMQGIIGCDLYTKAIEGTQDRLLIAKSIQAKRVNPEYEFCISTNGEHGDWMKLQKYGMGKECVVPGKFFEQDVWIKVCCREKGNIEADEKCCIRFRSVDE